MPPGSARLLRRMILSPRLRRVVVTLVFLLLIAAFAACIRGGLYADRYHTTEQGVQRISVWLDEGSLVLVCCGIDAPLDPRTVAVRWRFDRGTSGRGSRSMWPHLRKLTLSSKARLTVKGWELNLPLWIPLGSLSIPMFLSWRRFFRDRRASRSGCCVSCGYCLNNLAHVGRCPECGSPTAPERRSRPG